MIEGESYRVDDYMYYVKKVGQILRCIILATFLFLLFLFLQKRKSCRSSLSTTDRAIRRSELVLDAYKAVGNTQTVSSSRDLMNWAKTLTENRPKKGCHGSEKGYMVLRVKRIK